MTDFERGAEVCRRCDCPRMQHMDVIGAGLICPRSVFIFSSQPVQPPGSESREASARALLPVDGKAPQWIMDCKDAHIDRCAANPGRWPVCLECAFTAIGRALAPDARPEETT